MIGFASHQALAFFSFIPKYAQAPFSTLSVEGFWEFSRT